MQVQKKVTIIPKATEQIKVNTVLEIKKRRVAGYARVSTELEEQQNSYKSQLDYYEKYISLRDDWEFAGMYSDEGITGTSTKKRDGFNNMVNDALSGKIDMIITKSISRFARNTVDTLSTVRKLKNSNVEVYFEKENIYTFDSKGELLLTILSSLAQEESRSISENTTWGQRKRMADGHGCLPFSRFLGYDRGPNGEFVINEEQAKVVQRIYLECLEGKSAADICRILAKEGIKTVTGKTKWDTSTVLSILRNEKYKGDCLMQKYYVNDFLEKKLIKNNGELQQYYVENHHPAIVSPEIYEAVQDKLNSKRKKNNISAARDFSSMVVCGDCGENYGSKVWHSNSKYRKIVYRCNAKYKGNKCTTPAVYEDTLKFAFVEAINKLIKDKDEIIENLNILINMKKEKELSLAKIEEISKDLSEAENNYRDIIDSQKKHPLPFEEYEDLIKDASSKYEDIRQRYNDLISLNEKRKREIITMTEFINRFKDIDKIVQKYDYDLMKRVLERIVIYNNKVAKFEFIGCQSVEVKI